MNMRWLTAGESHGQALSAIVEGIPASVSVTTADIDYHLQRRRLGVGRGARQNFEADKVTILGGVRLGLTQGGPIAIQVGNSEWPKWEKVMSADPVPEDEIKDLARNAPLTRPTRNCRSSCFGRCCTKLLGTKRWNNYLEPCSIYRLGTCPG